MYSIVCFCTLRNFCAVTNMQMFKYRNKTTVGLKILLVLAPPQEGMLINFLGTVLFVLGFLVILETPFWRPALPWQ